MCTQCNVASALPCTFAMQWPFSWVQQQGEDEADDKQLYIGQTCPRQFGQEGAGASNHHDHHHGTHELGLRASAPQ